MPHDTAIFVYLHGVFSAERELIGYPEFVCRRPCKQRAAGVFHRRRFDGVIETIVPSGPLKEPSRLHRTGIARRGGPVVHHEAKNRLEY